jgi:hypothetical protein
MWIAARRRQNITREIVSCDIGNMAGKVAGRAAGIGHSRSFGVAHSDTDPFHLKMPVI